MAKTLYYNGDIITMEEGQQAEAVLVNGGYIEKTGTKEELLALAGEDVLLRDLEGHTMMPAFIDPHGHFMNYAVGLLQVSLADCTNFQEIEKKISDYIRDKQIAPGDWVICRDYDHNSLMEKTAPDKKVLDRAAPDNPLMIKHQSGHMGVFNSLGLKSLGLTVDSPCPPGGRYAIEDGELTGYMEEAAFVACQKKVPMNSVGELTDAVLKAQEVYASHGIATAQEGMMVDEMAALYQYLVNQKVLKLDIVGYADMEGGNQLLSAFGEEGYVNHFRMGGYKIFLDGSPQGHTAWMLEPYVNDKEGYCGYPTLTEEQVAERVSRAWKEGRQLLAHCNGDAAAKQYIRAFQRVEETMPMQTGMAARPVMIHAQLLRVEDLDAVKALGMIPSFFVAHVWHWGDVHIDSFGLARASEISPAGSAQRRGMCYTFHQDAPVIEPDMLETVWCAVNRITKNGVKLGADECISTMDALKAVTIHGAYQYGEEDVKGSIREGKKADLVILDRSPLKTPLMELRDIQVVETIKEGNTIFNKRSEDSPVSTGVGRNC